MVGLDADHIITQHAENGVATDTIRKDLTLSAFISESYQMATAETFDTSTPSKSYTDTVTKTGYYPIGIIGYRSTSQFVVPYSLRLQNQTSGSCKLQCSWRYIGSSSATSTLYVEILWCKIL